MKKSDQQLLTVGAVLLGAGLILSRNPNCNRGCKTLAQHLLDHGIDDLLAVLIA